MRCYSGFRGKFVGSLLNI